MAPRRLLALPVVLVLLLLAPSGAWALDRPALSRSLDRALEHARAGFAGVYVRDLTGRRTLYESNADSSRVPASVEKLFTTATALRVHGPQARIGTRLVRSGAVDADGRLDGDLVLVGGGDPTFADDDVARLARAVRRAGIQRVSGSVLGDESRFDDLRGGPRKGGAYDSDIDGVLGALTVNRGFSKRAGGPALAAARRLVRALRARGVTVLGRTGVGAAPPGARQVGRVQSPTILDLARATNVPSDNFLAEMLLKGLGAGVEVPGTTAGGAAVVRATMKDMGVDREDVADGSGLSRANRVSARQVVGLLSSMHESELGEAFESTLAVAGRTGTLRRRLRGSVAAGACRAKTGTLDRVSTLAGLCTTRTGHTVAFALLLNDVAIWRAHESQDAAARAIVNYTAGAPAP